MLLFCLGAVGVWDENKGNRQIEVGRDNFTEDLLTGMQAGTCTLKILPTHSLPQYLSQLLYVCIMLCQLHWLIFGRGSTIINSDGKALIFSHFAVSNL